MERNVQVSNRKTGQSRCMGFILLVFFMAAAACGCQKKPLVQEYSFEERLWAFEEDTHTESFPAFAEDICVIGRESGAEEDLTAEAAAVLKLNGGEALFCQNALERMNPASTTKIMTALLTLKYGNLDDMVTVTDAAIINESGSSMAGIVPGDQISLESLLYGLMMPSGNDAANAIAVHMDGSIEAFVDRMNEEAWKIGATGTHFANANGLTDASHYTTAYDLYLMFHEALKYDKFREVIGTGSYTADLTGADGQAKSLTWTVGNYYMNGKTETPKGLSVFGGKTGTTQAAGYCLVMGSRTEGMQEYVSVIMKASSRSELYQDMTKIISKIVN